MAQPAAPGKVVPRAISFTGALQTLAAFRPLLDLRPPARVADRPRLFRELLDAIATHRVADRPDRYEPRVKERRRNHSGWLTRPRDETKRKLAKRVTQSEVPFVSRTTSVTPFGAPSSAYIRGNSGHRARAKPRRRGPRPDQSVR